MLINYFIKIEKLNVYTNNLIINNMQNNTFLRDLEFGVETREEDINIRKNSSILNPFLRKKKIDDKYINDMTLFELKNHFDRLLILRFNGNNDELYALNDVEIDDDLFKYISKKIYIIEGSISMLKNKLHKNNITVVSKEYLELCNNNLELNDKELILPLFNINSKIDITNYINQYDGFYSLKDYIILKLLNNYNQVRENKLIANNICNMLSNLKESNYWTLFQNCKCNITLNFLKRGFNLTSDDLNNKLKDVLEKINNINIEEGYFENMYRKQVYVDVSNDIKQKGYTLYSVHNLDEKSITTNEINDLLDGITNSKELYYLIMNLIVSKDHCHLIINNSHAWDIINRKNENDKSLLQKYFPIFRYVMSYAWITFYLEECIKRTRIKYTDRHVFTIDTASKLPVFPFSHSGNLYRYSPYLTLLISNKIINSNKNNIGISYISDHEYGINTLDKFKENVNIFASGKSNINIFKNLNWNNIAISGSIMTACIPKNNPLMKLFENYQTYEEQFSRFCDEYYCKADIDMMCNLNDNFEYINKAYEVYENIKETVKSYSDTKIVPFKSVSIIVDKKFIENNILPKCNYSLNEILAGLYTPEIRKLFEHHYLQYKLQTNIKYIETPYWKDSKYQDYFDIIPIENVRIIVVSENYENNEKELFKVSDSLKFKIKFTKLNHDIEFFKIKYEDFFSTVAKFHLPCVRAFYNGDNTYILPSAITAYMTYMNIDYKYFAGSKDPIEILNKYRMRGFGTYLNDKEKIHMSEYSKSIDNWSKLYNTNNIFGPLHLTNALFNPRKFGFDQYKEYEPVSLDYKIPTVSYIDTEFQIFAEYHKLYNYINNKLLTIKDIECINENGYIIPLKKWIIDAGYDLIKN
jgi:hypothetical protein